MDAPGADARILRIRASDGQQETALDLGREQNLNLVNVPDLGFSIAPSDSVVFNRPIRICEIFSYDIRDE